MRRIVAFNNVSADGYFTTSGGSLDWVIPDEEVAGGGASQIPAADTILFGRKTYEMFESFWPHALDDSKTAPDPHGPGRSKAMHAMAVFINEATKIVFSRTLKNVTWKNARLIREFDASAVEAMKREPGKDMMIFGSGSIASALTEHGLIDEYQFIVNPVLLGTGRPLIGGVANRLPLELLDAKAFKKSGDVMIRYAKRPS
ncbi:MAG TPA: dihydrofolate reductase family protein [Gemmatimonadaceae bacterium]